MVKFPAGRDENVPASNGGDASAPRDGSSQADNVTVTFTGTDSEPAQPDQTLPDGARTRYFGDYELVRILGKGGMGVVYEARQIRLGRPVALKMIRAAEFASEDERRRFQNEAEAVATLDHPHIVPIYEVGEQGDQRYFSMKLIDGEGLNRGLSSYRDDPHAAARLVVTVAEAMHHAHQRGILHRDLKPANILVDRRGEPYVTDFGLARRVNADSELTQSGAILGTPSYMPPEQAAGDLKAVTTASDVYGLGAVLYALLTGRGPFTASTVLETLQLVRERAPEPPSKHNGQVPCDLEVICLKCLEKDPRRRYGSAQALADDLRRWLSGEPIQARPAGAGERAWKWVKRHKVVAAATALVLGSLAAGTVVSTLFAVKAQRAAGVAAENEQLAERRAGEAAAERDAARRSAVRLAVASGSRFREAGDLNQALLWYARAWRLDAQDDPRAEAAHRLRLGGVLAQMPQLVGVYFHAAPVRDARFAPDGTAVLTHTGGTEVHVWNVQQSRHRFPPLRQAGPVRHACYSTDGKFIAVTTGAPVLALWNAADGTPAFQLAHPAPLLYAAFSPDGSLVASCAEDGKVRLWDLNTKECRYTLELSADDPPAFAAFDPAGKRLVTANRSNGARLWDPVTGRSVGPEMAHELQGTDSSRGGVAIDPRKLTHELRRAAGGRHPVFRPNGGHLVTATATSFHVHDTGDGREVASRVALQVDRVIYTPVGEHLAVFSGPDVRRYTARELKEQTTAAPDEAIVGSLADRRWFVGGGRTMAHPRDIHVGAYAPPDGQLLATASAGGLVHLWETTTGQAVPSWTMPRCASDVTAVSFSPDGRFLLAASLDGTARIWSTEVERPAPNRFDCGNSHLLSSLSRFSVCADGSARLTCSGKGLRQAFLHELKADRVVRAGPRWVHNSSESIALARLSADGSRAVICTASGVQCLDAANGQKLGGLIPSSVRSPHHYALDHVGRRLAVFESPTAFAVWDLDRTKRLLGPVDLQEAGQQPQATDSETNHIALSPDGRKVAVSVPGAAVGLWDVETGWKVPWGHVADGQTSSVFSADSNLLVTCGADTTARVWESATGAPASALLRHPTSVRAAGLSPDGRSVVTVDAAAALRIWDAASGDVLYQWSLGNMVAPPDNINYPIDCCWFSADGRRVFAGAYLAIRTGTRSVRFWSIPVPTHGGRFEALPDLARLLTGQQFDATEAPEFVHPLTFLQATATHRRAFEDWQAARIPRAPADGQPGPPLPPQLDHETDPHRRAARWVLWLGGKVTIQVGAATQEIGPGQDLPAAVFQLRTVNLDYNRRVTDVGLARLRGVPTLTYLRLVGTPTTDAGLEQLSELTGLQVLMLGDTNVGDAGVAHLARMRKLRMLTLYKTAVGDRGLDQLAHLNSLKYLDLGGTRVTDAGLPSLKGLTGLTYLQFGSHHPNISDHGLVHLTGLANLDSLVMSGAITDAGLEHLRRLTNLKNLTLAHTRLTNAGLERLKEFQRLENLHISSNEVTPAGIAQFRAARPKCNIQVTPAPK